MKELLLELSSNFLASELLPLIRAAQEVRREHKFVFDSGEGAPKRGRIDLLTEEKTGMRLFDYKYRESMNDDAPRDLQGADGRLLRSHALKIRKAAALTPHSPNTAGGACLHIRMKKTVVIIPALNEERSIGQVIADIPQDLAAEIVVANNGSTDSTAQVASDSGATVIDEARRGYGQACLAGMDYIKNSSYLPDIIVFLDADYSDYPKEMKELISPITEGGYDLVIGSRTIGERQKGALLPQALVGNYIATKLIRLLYRVDFTDLGSFQGHKVR